MEPPRRLKRDSRDPQRMIVAPSVAQSWSFSIQGITWAPIKPSKDEWKKRQEEKQKQGRESTINASSFLRQATIFGDQIIPWVIKFLKEPE